MWGAFSCVVTVMAPAVPELIAFPVASFRAEVLENRALAISALELVK